MHKFSNLKLGTKIIQYFEILLFYFVFIINFLGKYENVTSFEFRVDFFHAKPAKDES